MIRWLPTIAGAVGIVLAFFMYGTNTKAVEKMNEAPVGLRKLLWNKWYVDEIYDATVVRFTGWLADRFWKDVDTKVIDGTVNGSARLMEYWASTIRVIQTGNVQNYAMSFLVGVTVILFLGVYLMVSLVLFTPLLAALFVLLLRKEHEDGARWIAFGASLLTFFLSLRPPVELR